LKEYKTRKKRKETGNRPFSGVWTLTAKRDKISAKEKQGSDT